MSWGSIFGRFLETGKDERGVTSFLGAHELDGGIYSLVERGMRSIAILEPNG